MRVVLSGELCQPPGLLPPAGLADRGALHQTLHKGTAMGALQIEQRLEPTGYGEPSIRIAGLVCT